jgi:hypothetical protein
VSKYGNEKVRVDGLKFQSVREAKHYVALKAMERTGMIASLQMQVPYVLVPSVILNGRKKPDLKYYADFFYVDKEGIHVVDVKGAKTAVYRIKKHLMKYQYNIEIEEI